MKKIIKLIIKLFIMVCLTFISVLCYLGYTNYKQAIDKLPIDTAINNIRNKDNYIEYDELSQDYIDAVIAVEDNRFFTRYGIDIKSIGRAFKIGLIEKQFDQGGSTITQQLSKNIYFDFERSLIRKVSEVFMTYNFENNYSKEDIFEAYVNIIYFGDGYYGIYDASKGYFNKNIDELNLAETALLAGLPQSPSNYQLSNGLELAIKRQKIVLDKMLELEYISVNEYNEAINYPIKDSYNNKE